MQKNLISRAVWAGVLSLTVFTGVQNGPAEDNSTAFFPWKTGNQWVYLTQKKGSQDSFDMKVEIEGAWTEENLSGQIMRQRDRRGTMREFLLQDDKGIFIYKLGLSKSYTPEVYTRFRPPVPRVIFPLDPGTKVHWEGRLKVAMINKPIVF